MVSYQSVNGANIVSLEDSEKNENFWKKDFWPQNDVFQNIFSQNNDLPQIQSCKFHFFRGKRQTHMGRKKVNPLRD